MSEFQQQVQSAAEQAVLKFIRDGGWLMPSYESRVKVPADWYAAAWAAVDTDKIRAALTARLEAELADRIVNQIAAELATDIKQILSVQERREAIRNIAREHMTAIMRAGATP